MSLSFGAGIALCAAVMGTNPRGIFERVSADSGTTDTRTRLARDETNKRLLDSVLGHSMILYGSGMRNSNLHLPKNLPLMVVVGGAGQVASGQGIRVAAGTPVTNLPLALVGAMGVGMNRFGDSTGAVNRLSDV